MRFTMAQPEVSCHPERCFPARARSSRRRSATTRPGPSREPGEGRLPRYTWRDHYAELRERLDELGRRLGGEYRVLVDANQHVDREGAGARRGRLLRQEHDADHAPARLVGRARHARHRREIEPTPPLELDCGSCRSASTPARRARSTTGGARRDALPLLLDAGAGADPRAVSRGARRTGLRLRHLPGRLPWNRGIERRRAGRERRGRRAPHVSLVDWLERRRASSSRARPALRAAQRPALARSERARRAGEHRQAEDREAAAAFLDDPDPTAARARGLGGSAGSTSGPADADPRPTGSAAGASSGCGSQSRPAVIVYIAADDNPYPHGYRSAAYTIAGAVCGSGRCRVRSSGAGA